MTDFKGKLGNYKIIETEDKTQTVWSEFFDEACHNLSGAYLETIHNYIEGCEIPKLLNYEMDINILDVGFGLGVGLSSLIDTIGKIDQPKQPRLVKYYSIELDEDFLLWTLYNKFPNYKFIKKSFSTLDFYHLNVPELNLEISIFVGDGRLTLPKANQLKLIGHFDAIFQDPFSPKKNPTLWTVEWFLLLKSMSKETVNLSTYSASVSIRKSLICAGWVISNDKGFGHKKSMTKAKLSGEITQELKLQLERSPTLEMRDK